MSAAAPERAEAAGLTVDDERTAPVAPQVRVLGVRHHGPGSARSVVAALSSFRPDAVLVEGPADADPLLALAADAGMEPPVALLAYDAASPRSAVFWPMAVFSPEWQAITWAAREGVPVRFCDLPAAAVLGERAAAEEREAAEREAERQDGDADGEPDAGPADDADDEADAHEGGDAEDAEDAEGAEGAEDTEDTEDAEGGRTDDVAQDPVAALASAAGFDDPERWWDAVVESRRDGEDPFEPLTEAMAALREHAPPRPGPEAAHEERREAHMRAVLRATLRSGASRVAVVCGAWHAPALVTVGARGGPTASADAATLRGMARVKASLTWVPWTHGRLASASGYGAGITSPGWYHHLFTAPDLPVHRWLSAVAASLRGHDLPVSSAHVVEAVRLAQALSSLRGRALAGLEEVTEATRAVLVGGDEIALALVTRDLVVGEALGTVPDAAPTVPLEADRRTTARRLRLKEDASARSVRLDLREARDLERSRLLHRLALLDVAWGVPERDQVANRGTFRETWALAWAPGLSVDVVAASLWGTTVASAATARLADRAVSADLAGLTEAVGAALLADLPDALPALLRALDARAAAELDVVHLMDALPPLVRALRYGDVRSTDTSALVAVADALLVRVCAALPASVVALDDDAAAGVRAGVEGVHAAVALRGGDGDPTGDRGAALWRATLANLAGREGVHPTLAGRLVRLLLDAGEIDAAGAGARLSAALSVGAEPAAKAAWVEGFLAGSGTLLVHDRDLLALLDGWVAALDEQAFVDVLALLRRAFSAFTAPERRSIGERVALPRTRGAGSPHDDDADDDSGAGPLDEQARLARERGDATLATTLLLLGGRP